MKVFFSLLFLFCVNGQEDIFIFIKEYYMYRNVKNLIVVDSSTQYEFVTLSKYLSGFGFRTSFCKPSNYSLQLFERNDYDLGIVLNMNCENSTRFIKEVSTVFDYPFKYTNKWLLLDEHKLSNNTINLLSSLNINIDAEITYVEIGDETSHLYDIYNTGKYHFGRLIVDYLGHWKRVDGFSLLEKKYKYVQRSNLTGVILKCMIVIRDKPKKEKFSDYIASESNTHLDSMHRFNYALLLHLKEMYNYSYHMMRTLSWGYKHNGTFDGMVGQLERMKIDIGGSPIFFRLERAQVVDYAMQTWTSRPCFIFRHPKRVSSIFNIYFRPFEPKVWYSLCAMIIFVMLLTYGLIKAQSKLKRHLNDESSLSEAFLLICAAIFQQGTTNNISILSGRVILITIFIFSLLFYQFYSASIVSSLLMEPPKTIRTLENLLNSNLRVGIEDVLYTTDYFKRTNDSIAQELYRKKIFNKNYHNLFTAEDGLKIVQNGGFALHVDTAVAYKIIMEKFSENEICELSEINLFSQPKMMTVVQKQLPYRKLITYGLRKMAESGLMARQRLLWHAKKPKCVHKQDASKYNVTIVEFSSLLVFLLSGMTVSIIILLIENLYKKFIHLF